MQQNDFNELVDNLKDWKQTLILDNVTLFKVTLSKLQNHLKVKGKTCADLYPPPKFIFEAFRQCPEVKVVILGLDPYTDGSATGLSFASSSLTGSLKNIFKCLHQSKLITIDPKPDLITWAQQGVLMLNLSLTILRGEPAGSHLDIWADFINSLLKKLMLGNVIICALGTKARDRVDLLFDPQIHSATRLFWNHPSPLSTYNNPGTATTPENPGSFKFCDVFVKINDWLSQNGRLVINWGGNVIKPESCVIFTDGGTVGNGEIHCKASWAFYISGSGVDIRRSGLVTPVVIKDKKYTSSNQRAELSAILFGLEKATTLFPKIPLLIVSDSQYSINCITLWYKKWVAENKLADKQNVDLISEIYKLMRDDVKFKHVNSHIEEPADLEAKKYWTGNNVVDKMCNDELNHLRPESTRKKKK